MNERFSQLLLQIAKELRASNDISQTTNAKLELLTKTDRDGNGVSEDQYEEVRRMAKEAQDIFMQTMRTRQDVQLEARRKYEGEILAQLRRVNETVEGILNRLP